MSVCGLEVENGDHGWVADEQQVAQADEDLRHLHALVGLPGLPLQVRQFVSAHGLRAGGEGGADPGAVVGDEGDELPEVAEFGDCLLYTSPSPRDGLLSRMPSSA